VISVEEALKRIRARVTTLPAEQVSLSEALGRVLAEDLRARVTHPPFDVSAMDGYAVRAADVSKTPATLSLIGRSRAGEAFPGKVGRDEAVRIFTGAPVPEGADAVVMQEVTESDGTTVTLKETVTAGKFIRPAGLDFSEGELLLTEGRRLTSRDLGLIASMNLPWLRVRRQPRVAIMVTGDEVVMPGEPLGQGRIVNSNGRTLAAFVTACGGIPVDLGIAGDSRASLLALARGASGADLLVTTGGVSVGDHDIVQETLGESGLEVDFWKVAMRPGKPLLFGRLGATPMFGMPGNPVSTVVCATIFLKPAITALLGLETPPRPPATARLATDLEGNGKFQEYLRARLSHDDSGALLALPFGRQDSSMLATLARADCLLIRPPHAPPARAGESVPIIELNDGLFAL
jgi:molybdopterin molybdotransferase